MESWVLEGDSYSFLCSSSHSFSLRHRDGPDRVEIFDITSIPNTRSAISETTCLCDIFGDDCESPSLSSSPTSASFLKRDLDEHLESEDVNDSSGSYRTAHSSEPRSDISDASEDPSSPQTDLILSNDKTALPSRIPTNVDNSDPSQTENQKELHLSLAMSPGDNNRGCERQPRNKGWSEEKAAQEKGAQNGAECSYRGEQVELSVSARNRKGPASHGPASLSPDPKSGIPARCYFESSLTTPQQSLLRAQSLQIKDKSCARRVQSAFQSNHSSAGNLPSECTSETSSMGSESDEADNEVKRFTDLGFRSLPSPQGDYLDVYNSSQRSSTNVSQPSTMESPGAVTWMSYADLHGSALHGKDFCHTSSFLPHGMLDPAKRFEMGSFECVDVAVESTEEFRRGRRTVPKRQIQLKRRNTDESKSAEKADNVLNLPTVQRCSRVSLVRQHSTLAGVQEDLQEGEMEIQTDRKMLQKSASLDETSTKTKMASTIIKSVLSKKMETPTKESSKSESSSPSEDKNKQTEALPAGAPTHTENQILNSSLPSECSLSSGDSAGRDERNPRVQKKSRPPKVLPKPYFKANFIPTYSNTGVGPFQGKMSVKDKMTPRKADPFENNTPKKHVLDKREKGSKTSNVGEKYSSDSANAPARNTNSDASKAASMQNRMSNRDKGHPKSASSVATDIQQESNTSVLNSSNEQQENLNVNEEHVTAASCLTSQPVIAVASQAHTYAQPEMASSKNQLHKDDFQFYASDDPPSYDERESFSPLLLSDLSPRRLNRYHPTSKHSSCCCTTSHPLLGHTYHGSQNRTPPASHSPGQVLSYPGGSPQAQVCPHQCRPDGHPLNYPSVSPKTTVPKAPAKIQPLHRSHTCPAPVTQSHGDEQQPPPSQQMDRRSANLRSPQTASGAPYREHSRSPNIAALEPRSQFFNTEDIPPAFGHDYGGDGPGGGGVLYPENASGLGYGQSPRRVLLDPETGKYFYIEVPVQPLRKMLFDPEMGQYVEVLIPQHAMSHSDHSSKFSEYI
ncbi:hypothetical protein P4O66_003901 [Electrophorus voltai]|uniref:DUF4585 domain-containing protein n=1 Tax=Electrophorus voltai TaxID=2609070 RepID=A0AAD8ZRV2_9TELE|nr:hypothetical protein P4O66_003901 [Electrophorus voltai]